MHALVNIALRAARDAAEVIARHSERLDRIRSIEVAPGQSISSMERDAERSILYHLQKAYPDYSIESRLSGSLPGKDTINTWIIDPLQGHHNANKGYGHFCVSIALKSGNRVNHAVVLNPLTREEFTASRGNGAQLNAGRLRGSSRDKLEAAFIGLDTCDENPNERNTQLELQKKLQALGCYVRASGSTALDLVYAAAGKLDAGWCLQSEPCALPAAILVLQEAGALISDHTGNPGFTDSRELIYGNPKCFKQMLQLRQSL
ncbi:MAG: inositol monophosphatase family protein [Pseudomonadales bacterium]|nr:inositol monophosphatase family protein [Pseudomonadales bacterium]